MSIENTTLFLKQTIIIFTSFIPEIWIISRYSTLPECENDEEWSSVAPWPLPTNSCARTLALWLKQNFPILQVREIWIRISRKGVLHSGSASPRRVSVTTSLGKEAEKGLQWAGRSQRKGSTETRLKDGCEEYEMKVWGYRGRMTMGGGGGVRSVACHYRARATAVRKANLLSTYRGQITYYYRRFIWYISRTRKDRGRKKSDTPTAR